MAFGELGQWLLDTVGAQKAATTINRYLPFYIEIERAWGRIPDYSELLGHFGAEGLRRARLPMRCLAQSGYLTVDAAARENNSERRRIEAMLDSLVARPHLASIARAYATALHERLEQGKTTLRSIRLSLRAPVTLLDSLDVDSSLPDQNHVDFYLTSAPGQRAALVGFVNFLNAQFGLSLVARTNPSKARQTRIKRLERSLHALARVSGGTLNSTWLAQTLALFHGLPRNAAKNAALEDVDYRSIPGTRAVFNNKSYWVPKPEGYLKLLNTRDTARRALLHLQHSPATAGCRSTS